MAQEPEKTAIYYRIISLIKLLHFVIVVRHFKAKEKSTAIYKNVMKNGGEIGNYTLFILEEVRRGDICFQKQTPLRSDISMILTDKEGDILDTFVIECRFQNVTGTVYQKLPYLLGTLVNKNHKIILADGSQMENVEQQRKNIVKGLNLSDEYMKIKIMKKESDMLFDIMLSYIPEEILSYDISRKTIQGIQ